MRLARLFSRLHAIRKIRSLEEVHAALLRPMLYSVQPLCVHCRVSLRVLMHRHEQIQPARPLQQVLIESPNPAPKKSELGSRKENFAVDSSWHAYGGKWLIL